MPSSPSSPPPTNPSPTSAGRFAPYRRALSAISARTGTPLPSLIASFAIVHELTAIVPVVGLFYAFRGLGAGDRTLAYIESRRAALAEGDDSMESKMVAKSAEYLDEGEKRAMRFGKRYGLWGLDDDSRPQSFAGDIACAAAAYGATKALLPVRIAGSLYLAPGFSRAFLEPTRRGLVSIGRRLWKSSRP